MKNIHGLYSSSQSIMKLSQSGKGYFDAYRKQYALNYLQSWTHLGPVVESPI